MFNALSAVTRQSKTSSRGTGTSKSLCEVTEKGNAIISCLILIEVQYIFFAVTSRARQRVFAKF